MKKLFYFGLLGLALFEVANVYFIMPMPGSQRMNSIDFAYFLYSYRWWFRILFGLMIMIGSVGAFTARRYWLAIIAIVPVVGIVYAFNFQMTADHMFLQPEHLVFKPMDSNALTDSSIVVAVYHNHVAKAYPIRSIQYHHQVRDTVGGLPVMVTYCNVCRTGRVFEPVVEGKPETFRLVGMDHFNAMFEDATTRSWWRQANGEAITGDRKGLQLSEVSSSQLQLKKFFELYPNGLVLQFDPNFKTRYDSVGRYEKGRSRGQLTRTDSLAWRDKSWVLGIDVDGNSTAIDWRDLQKKQLIELTVGSKPVVVGLAADGLSFFAFERSVEETFIIRNDSLIGQKNTYDLAGRSVDGSRLIPIKAYQEFWHSWQTFHPKTAQYKP